MESEVVVVHADTEPIQGITDPGSHQIYRNLRVTVEIRELGVLHPDEVRVQMCYAGICGTDVHLVEKNPDTGYICCSAPATIPPKGRIIGHEGVGRIIETGSNVRHVGTGDYVTFESIIVCHYCDMCRKGKFNQCRNAKLMGLEKDGLFGSVVDAPAMLAHNVTEMIKDDKDIQALACVEPAGVAYVACQNTHIAAGDVVVIFGAGPIGLFTAILGKMAFGASAVHIVEPVEFRRKFAEKWCDFVYTPEDFFYDPPKDLDVLIEASGNLDNINRIFRRINANGRVALLARSGNPLMLNAVDYMITNQISVIGSRGHLCGAFIDIINLYKTGRIPLDAVITNVVTGISDLAKLLRSTENILTENCKVLTRLG